MDPAPRRPEPNRRLARPPSTDGATAARQLSYADEISPDLDEI